MFKKFISAVIAITMAMGMCSCGEFFRSRAVRRINQTKEPKTSAAASQSSS